MTETELNEVLLQIEQRRLEQLPSEPSRRGGRLYRQQQTVRKNDHLMRIVTMHYVPLAGYFDWGFDGATLLHTGKYIKYPKNSICQKWIKRETSRRIRCCKYTPRKGNFTAASSTTGGRCTKSIFSEVSSGCLAQPCLYAKVMGRDSVKKVLPKIGKAEDAEKRHFRHNRICDGIVQYEMGHRFPWTVLLLVASHRKQGLSIYKALCSEFFHCGRIELLKIWVF